VELYLQSISTLSWRDALLKHRDKFYGLNNCGSFPDRGKDFLSLRPRIQIDTEAHPAPCEVGTVGSFVGCEAAGA
jgi:hypothetical protein